MDEIVEGLYVGTVEEAKGLLNRREWRAICVLEYPPEWWPRSTVSDWASIPVFDSHYGRANTLNLEIVSRLIDGYLSQKCKVLVCCAQSMERSPLAVAYYLSKRNKISLEEAYGIVESKHPITLRRVEWV
ncbi:MAG: dual specificity protein phosphatase [Thermoproteota archaeon]